MEIRNVILLTICLIVALHSNAQPLTVGQLESKWESLYYYGTVATDNHDYCNAQKYLTESITLLKSNDATNTKYYIYSLIKLGETYDRAGEKKNAETITNELKALRRNIRPNSKREVDYLYNIGYYLTNLNRYNEALDYFNEALLLDVPLSQMQGERSLILHRMAFCYYCLGDIRQAIASEIESIRADNNRTPDYQQALAFYYFKSKDWYALEKVIPCSFDYTREPVLRKFAQSKGNERILYWDKVKYFFTDYLPLYATENPSDTLSSYTYDAALLTKGILLAAENKTAELILNSNDSGLIRQYNRYLDLKKKKIRTIDEEFEMQALSDVFIRYQSEHKHKYRQDFRTRWKDVQTKLNENDIAIEFITVPGNNGAIGYIALSIKKDSKKPKLTHIAKFSEIEAVPSELYYTTPLLYKYIWGALEAEFDGIQNIYFSAAGVFHNIAIEYLPDQDGISLYQKKNVYRLTSTKEIVFSRNKNNKKSAIFGGINYDMDTTAMIEQSRIYDTISDTHFPISIDSTGLRGAAAASGFVFLEGTRKEIEDISLIEMKSGHEVEVFSGDNGSEANFKQLSGSGVNIIHIATHGFYYASTKQTKGKELDQLFYESNTNFLPADIDIIDEDKMLTRSGLVMAGANNIFKNVTLPKDVQDGILYADEIAKMNLSEVDLLVLSACQSGLGLIVSSEGVFGLQRGFKKAGVNSIVMSLWRVNDDATRILMTEFYKNLAAGHSKRESLTNAQNILRSINNGVYDKPEYWAAFIIIDALN